MKNQGISWTTAAESSRSADSLELMHSHAAIAGTVMVTTRQIKELYSPHEARKKVFLRSSSSVGIDTIC